MSAPVVTAQPATAERWPDVERLFGKNGACGGCWCMMWRLPRKPYERDKGDANRRALERLVTSGAQPGVLLYDGAQPVAWAAVGPRAEFVRLAASRILQPVDAAPAWCIPCLFVAKTHRRAGLSSVLVAAAARQAFARGAPVVEGYPHALPAGRALPPPFVWTGLLASFAAAGFVEVARRSPTRPIVRLERAAPAAR